MKVAINFVKELDWYALYQPTTHVALLTLPSVPELAKLLVLEVPSPNTSKRSGPV